MLVIFLMVYPGVKGIPMFDGRKINAMNFLRRENSCVLRLHCDDLWILPVSRYVPWTGRPHVGERFKCVFLPFCLHKLKSIIYGLSSCFLGAAFFTVYYLWPRSASSS